ncbi:tripartite tricarboxylate transporter TctB family protein [Terrihabitans sp. B22-R8]|uniref:tripartite tricarboxylate transporter TctB family protein n=1 Tax=Terrihabitans sp. B22-R8 TaxID=3425128 RepID=UPI00403CF4AE
MVVNRKDLFAGLIFIFIGLLFGLGTRDLPMGTAFRMGPGYFPLVLCGFLILIGIILAVRSIGREGGPLGGIPWRALLFILPATIIFGFGVRGLGLAPAVFIVAFSSAFASRQTGPLFAFALAITLTVFCVLVFAYGLGLPLQLFGPWVRF